MTTAFIQAEAQLNSVEMEEHRLKDNRPAGKSSEAKVDIQSEHLDSTHTKARLLIQDRDPKGINQSLKVKNVSRYKDNPHLTTGSVAVPA